MNNRTDLLDPRQSADWQQALARLAAFPKAVAPAWPVIHLEEVLARSTRLTERVTSTAAAKLLAYKTAVEEAVPGVIEALILFGSRARGDAHDESDYDVAIILRDGLIGDRDLDSRLTEVWLDQPTDDDFEIQTITLTAGDFRPARRELAMRIAMDGVPLR